jgi:hypothetical protein
VQLTTAPRPGGGALGLAAAARRAAGALAIIATSSRSPARKSGGARVNSTAIKNLLTKGLVEGGGCEAGAAGAVLHHARVYAAFGIASLSTATVDLPDVAPTGPTADELLKG